jgi:hypothetical protein
VVLDPMAITWNEPIMTASNEDELLILAIHQPCPMAFLDPMAMLTAYDAGEYLAVPRGILLDPGKEMGPGVVV